jgi:hypothetical protein
MECTILVALILALGNMWFEAKQTKRLQEQAPEYAKIINQAIWDKYGPGQKEAYYKLFPDIPSLLDIVPVIPEEFHTPCRNQGFVANSNSPEWFNIFSGEIEKLEQQIEQALQNGPFIAAPDESYFTDTSMYHPLNFNRMTKISHFIRQLAYRDWLRGDAESALKRLNTIIGLGESLKYACSVGIEQLIRIDINRTGLKGFDQLIWTDPDQEKTSLIYENLKKIKTNEWRLPGFICNPLMQSLITDDGFSSDQLAASMLLNQLSIQLRKKVKSSEEKDNYVISLRNKIINKNNKTDSIRALKFGTTFGKDNEKSYGFYDLCMDIKEAGLLPDKEIKPYKANSQLGKWSTLAALRKRCEQLPDAFYENDPLLSAEQARKLPKLTYAVSRLCDAPFNFQFFNNNDFARKRMAELKKRAIVLQAAYQWRIERDENGKWLTPEQMDNKFQLTNQIYYVVDNNPERLARHFIKKNIISDYTPKDLLVAAPGFFNAADSEIIYVQNVPSKTDKGINARFFRKSNHEWMEGMLSAMSPLVESVTSRITHASQQNDYRRNEYMDNSVWMRPLPKPEQGDSPVEQREYIVKIKIPRKTYWIMTDKANRILTNQLTGSFGHNQFEETNEIQLAGWEW